jgi:hypothetical protein
MASSTAIFIIYFIYLINRDGVGPVLKNFPRYLLPRRFVEVAFSAAALVVYAWAIIDGRLLHPGGSSDSLRTMAALIASVAMCNALQHYDDWARQQRFPRFPVVSAHFMTNPELDPHVAAARAAQTLTDEHVAVGPVRTEAHYKTEAQVSEDLNLQVAGADANPSQTSQETETHE